jgi:tetratricopeptide (TPR) repeat protein
MNRSPLLSSLLLGAALAGLALPPLPARAQARQAQPSYATYAAAMEAGARLLARKKQSDARAAFEAAEKLAGKPDEKADALMGVARSEISPSVARGKYQEAEKLEGISREKQAEATMGVAETFAAERKPEAAREVYTRLIDDPGSSVATRAAAMIGRGGALLKSSFISPNNANVALKDLTDALKLEGVPDAQKADALLLIGDLYHRTGKTSSVLDQLMAVRNLSGASGDQKSKALLLAGSFYQSGKNVPKAREVWTLAPRTEGASTDSRLLAHRSIAQTYVAERNTQLALAELEKALAIPDLSTPDLVELLDNVGDLNYSVRDYASARTHYSRILQQSDAGARRHEEATLDLGNTYAAEKNYATARETWEKLTGPNKGTMAVEALRLIGLSHAEQQDYAAARATFQRWLALPLANYWKEDAWLLIAGTHENEKSWDRAREAYQKLLMDEQTRSTRKVQAVLGIARAHQAEKKPAEMLQAFQQLPAAFKSTGTRSPAEASELGKYRTSLTSQLRQMAANQGKMKEQLPFAVALYRVAQQIQEAEIVRLGIATELGELYFTHGMLPEARAEFEQVTASPIALNFHKEKAAARLREIEERSKSTR